MHQDQISFLNSCPLSGSNDLREMKGYEKQYLVQSHPLGFVFSKRIPTEAELEKHYAGYNFNKYFSPITKSRYVELLEKFQSVVQGKKLFDVGCGRGFFLATATELGWDAAGNEVSKESVEGLRRNGLNVYHGDLDDTWFPENTFDVVTAFELLEHLNDPVSEMLKINRILKPGGLFFFTTPNFNALERYLLKSNYNVLDYPDHLSYYTPKTVNYLLTKCGFKKLKLQSAGISITRIQESLRRKNGKQSGHYISQDTSDERIRVTMDSNRMAGVAKTAINGILNACGVGNSLKGWYIKS